MTLNLLHRRLLSLLMAFAIILVATPLLPAKAVSGCDHMSMSASMREMDMKADLMSGQANSQNSPAKPTVPCNENLNCLGCAGCAAPATNQVSVVPLPKIITAEANWTSRLAGLTIAYKPALPPPISLV